MYLNGLRGGWRQLNGRLGLCMAAGRSTWARAWSAT